jgi:hypothetical protein
MALVFQKKKKKKIVDISCNPRNLAAIGQYIYVKSIAILCTPVSFGRILWKTVCNWSESSEGCHSWVRIVCTPVFIGQIQSKIVTHLSESVGHISIIYSSL